MKPMINKQALEMIDKVDKINKEMNEKWGIGVLEDALSDGLLEKFDKQHDLLVAAIDSKDNKAIYKQAAQMIKAWKFLDNEAQDTVWVTELPANVWHVKHSSGEILTIHQGSFDKLSFKRQGIVFSIEEIVKCVPARVLEMKKSINGTVTEVKKKENNDDKLV